MPIEVLAIFRDRGFDEAIEDVVRTLFNELGIEQNGVTVGLQQARVVADGIDLVGARLDDRHE
jgi:hypothetical protein